MNRCVPLTRVDLTDIREARSQGWLTLTLLIECRNGPEILEVTRSAESLCIGGVT